MTDFQRVKAKLLRDRLMDHQGVTRTARPRHCGRCHAAVLAGIDDLGITVSVHPTPTTTLGELEALMAGVDTFLLAGGRLIYRNASKIKARSPDEYDVHVTHQCGKPPPPTNPQRMKPPRKEYTNDDPIPF